MSARDIRRAAERGYIQTSWLESYCSFSFGSYQRVDRERFGALRVLNEDWIAPASGFAMHPHEDLEILLMPLQSVTAHEDSLGTRVNVRPNDLLVIHSGRGIRHSQMNGSSTKRDHHLQLWFVPRQRAGEPTLEHANFNPVLRRNRWELWASGYRESGVPAIDAEARVFRALLQPGSFLSSPVRGAHSSYLHVGTGYIDVQLLDSSEPAVALTAGDAIALPFTTDFRVQAMEPAELFLIQQPELSDSV